MNLSTVGTTNTGWERFGLATTGEVVLYELESLPSGFYKLEAVIGNGAPVTLAASIGGDEAGTFFPLATPTADPPSGAPAYGVVSQHPNAITVRWPDANGPTTIALANTLPLVSTCTPPDYPACVPDTCTDTGAGVVPSAFAAARLSDGEVWVGYVVQHTERSLLYTATSCNPDGGPCDCGASIVSDSTTWDLHVVRVEAGGDPGGRALLAARSLPLVRPRMASRRFSRLICAPMGPTSPLRSGNRRIVSRRCASCAPRRRCIESSGGRDSGAALMALQFSSVMNSPSLMRMSHASYSAPEWGPGHPTRRRGAPEPVTFTRRADLRATSRSDGCVTKDATLIPLGPEIFCPGDRLERHAGSHCADRL